jgi:hypothetical protein
VRRFFVTFSLALLTIPAVAWAGGAGPGDGTLAVAAATGSVNIAVRGALIGQIDRGRVTVEDPTPNDGKTPVVSGYATKKDLSDTKALYSGSDIRFRIIGGFFRAKVVGTGMDLSIVGKGSITFGPSVGLVTAGTYSLNGALPLPFPTVLTSFQLAAAGPPGG